MGGSVRKVEKAECRAVRYSLAFKAKWLSFVFPLSRSNLIKPDSAAKKWLVCVVTVCVGDFANETFCFNDL